VNGFLEYGLVLAATVAGALLRHGTVLLSARFSFPLGVLIVNAVGSLIGGVAIGAASALPPGWMLILLTGFCGALTTFSTFSVDTVRMARGGRLGAAIWNVVSNLALGLGCAALGAAIGLAVVGA
jgi:CrcB protein